MKTLSTALADYEYENSILTVTPRADLVLDRDEMETMLKEAVVFTNGEKYYTLVDTKNHVESTAEARHYYANSELSKYRYADALIVNSLATRIITNFYLTINKPRVPSKMFNTKNEGMQWLLELKRINEQTP